MNGVLLPSYGHTEEVPSKVWFLKNSNKLFSRRGWSLMSQTDLVWRPEFESHSAPVRHDIKSVIPSLSLSFSNQRQFCCCCSCFVLVWLVRE